MPAPALTEHQLLVFWCQLLALLLTARALGALARRLGQPSIVGELAAGILLGPSVLGALAPGVAAWLFPPDPVLNGLMAGIGWIGIFLLLILTGVETDLGLVRVLGRAAAWTSLGSLVVPLVTGFGLGMAMPDRFLGETDRGTFALFVATALVVSSLPVVATVLSQLGLMRRDFGQLTLASGMVNDVAGALLLGVLGGLAHGGDGVLATLARTLGGFVVLVGFAFLVGQRLIDLLLRRGRQRSGSVMSALAVSIIAALVATAAFQAFGIEGVIGAFLVGVLLGRSRYQMAEAFDHVEAITASVFAPIFFARAGLQVHLDRLADPTILAWTVVVVLAATASKLVGAYVGARRAGLTSREGLALGVGLNARGALGVVVATVGLTLGILGPGPYTIVVVMAIVTSVMAPLLLPPIARHAPPAPPEQARLERERRLSGNVLVRPQRVLLPSAGGPNSMLAARILDLAWPTEVEATVLSIGDEHQREEVARVRGVFEGRTVEHEHVGPGEPLPTILEHTKLGYGAVAIGATDRQRSGRLVSPLVDALLSSCSLPLVLVRRGTRGEPEVGRFRRLVVPVVGTSTGRAALEVAYGIAARVEAEVILAHVVAGSGSAFWPWRREAHGPRTEAAERVLHEAEALAAESGVHATPHIRRGTSIPDELLTLIQEADADLVVLTASVRQVSGRPFLGHTVEELLARADCTLVVVATPPGWSRPASARPTTPPEDGKAATAA